MRMLLKYCSLVTSIAGLVAAQHGGGGHSSGGGGGHASGGFHSSSSSMSRPSGGYSGFRNSPRVVTPPPIGLQPYASGFTGINRGAYNNSVHYGWPPTASTHPIRGNPPVRRPGRYGAYPFGYYPALGFGFYGDGSYDAYDAYDPYYDSAPAVPYAPPPEQYQPYAAMPDPNVQTGLGYYYPPVPYASESQQPAPAPDPPAVPITIILKSGQKLEMQNYAIMNGVLWDFTKQNSKRIPLASIDEAASAKATDQAGGSFPEESFATNPK
jgi:hypothetical protein